MLTAVLARLRTPRPSWGYICDHDPIPGGCTWTYHRNPDGTSRRVCGARMSRLRWVLVGRCGQHGGRR